MYSPNKCTQLTDVYAPNRYMHLTDICALKIYASKQIYTQMYTHLTDIRTIQIYASNRYTYRYMYTLKLLHNVSS